ncbi:MAG: SBBP repeat-containing protein, partial [Gemmataceae bacterium]
MFVYEISAEGSQMLYGTYFGGSGDDWPSFGLAVDPQGNVYFGGESNSGSNYPTKDATQTYGGGYDGVVSEIHPGPTSTDLMFSSCLCGSTVDIVQGFALDSQGNLHVSGATDSTDFPVVNAVQTQFADGEAGANLNDAFIAEFGTGLIGKVTPALGGTFGSTTVMLSGAGFESGATAELSSGGGPVVSGQFVKVSTDGATLRTTFDLTSVPPGTYDVEVVNPDTTSFVLPHSFTVQTGGGANLWVTLVGRSLIRVGTPSTFNVSYGNTGLNDAYFARVWVQFPTANLDYQLGATLTQPQITGNPIDVSGVPLDVKVGDQTVLPLVLPVVPAGGTGSVPISFTAATMGGITLKTWVNPAGSASIAPVLNPTPQTANSVERSIGTYSTPQCYADMAQYAYEAFAFSAPQACWNVFPQNSQNVAANAVAQYMNGDPSLNNFLMSLTQFLDQQDLAVNQCLASHGLGLSDFSGVLDSTIQNIVQLVENTITKNDCKVEVEIDADADDGDEDDGGETGTNGGGSEDPNDKSGPTGVTAARWVLANQPLTYTISFENDPTKATLPAQQVVITDKLDPTKVDLSTFALGPMGFNKTSITPPASVNTYTSVVDLRPAQDLLVQIQGSLNPTTGVVKWTFRSL